mgnify:CR=1 FL=1
MIPNSMVKEYEHDPVIADHRELYIDDLCVDQNRRGQHIGRVLYDHATHFAKEIGCEFLTLNVWCGNDNAMKFYEKAGMTPRSITMETKLC